MSGHHIISLSVVITKGDDVSYQVLLGAVILARPWGQSNIRACKHSTRQTTKFVCLNDLQLLFETV